MGVGITQTPVITFYHCDSIIKTNIAQYSAIVDETVTLPMRPAYDKYAVCRSLIFHVSIFRSLIG